MKLRVWAGVAVSAILLWLSIRDVDFGRAWAATQAMNALYLLPYTAVLVASILVRSARWQLLLAPIKRCSFWKLNSATLIGMMANNLLPLRAGEFLRAYAGARMEGIPFSTCLATAVLDRVLDGLTASAIFIFALVTYPLPDLATWSGYLASGLYALVLILLIGLVQWPKATLQLAAIVLRQLPEGLALKVGGSLRAFVSGLGVFHNPLLLVSSTILSIVLWFSYALGLYFMWLAFDIHLSLTGAFIVLLILTLGLTLPSTPGFVGAMEFAIVTGMQLFGVDRSQALAVAVVFHVTQFVPFTVGGLIALWAERLTLSEIAHVPTSEPAVDTVEA